MLQPLSKPYLTLVGLSTFRDAHGQSNNTLHIRTVCHMLRYRASADEHDPPHLWSNVSRKPH
jgi:hypothetical protein